MTARKAIYWLASILRKQLHSVNTPSPGQVIGSAHRTPLQRTLDNLDQVYSKIQYDQDIKSVSEIYEEVIQQGHKQLVLVVTSGRSGTRWLCEIFRAHENAEGGVERNRIAESFYRYIKFNRLPIDTAGIIEITKKEILQDWAKADISITVSPYFSHDLSTLFHELKADKVIWGINNPKFTVTSCLNKGLYLREDIRQNPELAVGFQPHTGEQWSHFFGRLMPRGQFHKEWRSLTRVGKISWFLNTLHMEILSHIDRIPKNKVWIFKLEEADQDYEYYLRMARAFGLKPILNEEDFLSLKQKTAFEWENLTRDWSKEETEQFEEYAADYIGLYYGDYLNDPGFLSS